MADTDRVQIPNVIDTFQRLIIRENPITEQASLSDLPVAIRDNAFGHEKLCAVKELCAVELNDDCWLEVFDWLEDAEARTLALTCRNLYALAWFRFARQMSRFFLVPRFVWRTCSTARLISIWETRHTWCKTCLQQFLTKEPMSFVCAGTKPVLTMLEERMRE